MEIWNNPSCSKCATARETFDLAGITYRLRPYLEQPPTADELRDVLDRLGAQPWDVCRLGEPVAADLGLAAWPRDPDGVERWIDAMVAHPQLIQRPIVLLDNGAAVVGRDADALRRATAEAAGQPGD